MADQSISPGDVITLGKRQVRVCGKSDGKTLVKDWRGSIAVRNVDTNRLTYISARRLLDAKRLDPARVQSDDPAQALGSADEIASLRAQLVVSEQARATLRTALETAVTVAQDAYKAWNNDQDSRVGKLVRALAGHTKDYRADIDALHDVRALAASSGPSTETKEAENG